MTTREYSDKNIENLRIKFRSIDDLHRKDVEEQ